MKKRLLVLALVLVMILSFSACAKKEEAPMDDMSYIKDNGKLVIGYTVFEPMNYTDENGEFVGFDTELAIAVCEKLEVEPEFIEINWDTKEVELNAKSIDVVWNGLTINEERKANMGITVPYVKNAQVLVAKADSGITGTADLVGKTVVAEVGSAGEIQVLGDEHSEPEANLAEAEYIGMNKQTDCLLEVKSGTAAAAVLDLTLASSMIGEGTDFADLMMVEGSELAVEEYGIAFRKDSNVTEIVNGILVELVEDGTLPTLAEKYGLSLAPAITE